MKKFTIKEVAEIVDNEGLDYSIMEYLNSNSISDEYLSELWKTAQEVLVDIQEILDEHLQDED